MPRSSNRSDDIRKLLRPNAERMVFEISGPSLWVDGNTSELVNDMTVLGKPSQSRKLLNPDQVEQAKDMGIPVRWPKTNPKASG